MSAPDGSLDEMRRLLHSRHQRNPWALDEQTAERLLAGSMGAADAPPEYRPVAAVLGSLAGAPTDLERAGESSAVETIRIALASSSTPRSTPRRSRVFTKLRAAKIAAATAVGALSLTTGLAMAGALPGAAQDAASAALSRVGITTPSPNSHAGDHPNTRGKSADHTGGAPTTTPPTTQPTVTTAAQPPQAGTGSDISQLATSTDATGVHKGAEISTAASNGQSQAGQHGNPPASNPAASTPAVSAPNGGGTGTAGQASNGASAAGTGTANDASGGHSTAGAGNASGHRP